jgi:hypothetical protein
LLRNATKKNGNVEESVGSTVVLQIFEIASTSALCRSIFAASPDTILFHINSKSYTTRTTQVWFHPRDHAVVSRIHIAYNESTHHIENAKIKLVMLCNTYGIVIQSRLWVTVAMHAVSLCRQHPSLGGGSPNENERGRSSYAHRCVWEQYVNDESQSCNTRIVSDLRGWLGAMNAAASLCPAPFNLRFHLGCT